MSFAWSISPFASLFNDTWAYWAKPLRTTQAHYKINPSHNLKIGNPNSKSLIPKEAFLRRIVIILLLSISLLLLHLINLINFIFPFSNFTSHTLILFISIVSASLHHILFFMLCPFELSYEKFQFHIWLS